MSNHRLALLAATVLGFTAWSSASAQHQDVFVGVDSDRIVVENGLDGAGEKHVFAADLGELGNPFGTDDPGYLLDPGQMNPGEILAYEVLGGLLFWDGAAWVASVPDAERVILTDVIGQQSIIDTSGVISLPVGFVDQADGAGGIHTHIDYEVENSGGSGDPSTGAYLIEYSLFGLADDLATPAYDASNPLRLALNLGLPDSEFDAAVEALLPADSDGDSISDSLDNCMLLANADQTDSDGDGIGNRCDPDIQQPNNCIVDFGDLSVLKAAFFSTPGAANWNPDADFDGDGTVNFSDLAIQKEFFFMAPGPGTTTCN